MKRRILSAFVLIVILLNVTPILTVGASDEGAYVDIPSGQGWSVNYTTATATDTRVVNLAKGISYDDGNYSLHINNDQEVELYISSTSFTSSSIDEFAAYELSFYIKNIGGISTTYNNFFAQIGWGGWVNSYANGDKGGVAKVGDPSSMPQESTNKDGWKRVYTRFDGATAATSKTGFRFVISKAVTDVYIDGISLVKIGDESTELIQNGSFEDGIYETEAIDTDFWSVSGTGTAEIVKGVAKTGDRSLHITSDTSTTLQIRNKVLTKDLVGNTLGNNQTPLVADISFWLKGSYTLPAGADGSQMTANIGWEWDASRLRFEANGNPRAMTKGETVDGWTKYTGTFDYAEYNWSAVSFTAPNWDPFFFHFEKCTCDIYIDDIEVTVKGQTVNLMGTSGTFELIPVATPAPTPTPDNILFSEIPADMGWSVVYEENEGASHRRVANIASGISNSGKSSLHITNHAAKNLSVYNSAFGKTAVENATGDYCLTMYIKNLNDAVADSSALWAMIGWGWDDVNGTDAAVVKLLALPYRQSYELQENGWYKATYILDADTANAHSAGAIGFRFFVNGEAANPNIKDIYIDDVSLVRVGDETNTNLLKNGDFEFANNDSYLVNEIKLYDGETEIHDLASVSGKSVTAQAEAISFDLSKLSSVQMLAALYEGDAMKRVVASEAMPLTDVGKITDVSVTIDMPVYDDVGSYKLKLFVFDGNGSGKPLKKHRIMGSIHLGNTVIFGDSYSAYAESIPSGYVYYYKKGGNSNSDVTDISEMWWQQLIDSSSDNYLLHNSSWAGTMICHTGYDGADNSDRSFVARMDNLIAENYFTENDVDTILIYGGTNDSWGRVPVGQLQYADWSKEDLYSSLPAFCYMLDRLKNTSPDSTIVCVLGAALTAELRQGYADACAYYGAVPVHINKIDLYNSHPTVKGMEQIKNKVMDAILNY